jgi:hypothetical protein
MANAGKQLEKLVREIEQILLPKGLKVLVNERVYNDEGVQIAEFDIEIKGKVGSTRINWLIECRDRPACGPAPGSWVEQLVGRRDRFNFDKVTAVSTTGFAQPAIDYARDKNIELRSVETLTIEHLKDWLLTSNLRVFNRRGKLLHADIHAEEHLTPELEQAIHSMISNADSNSRMLVSKKDGQALSVNEAWRRVLNHMPQLFNGIEPDKNPLFRTIGAHYINEDDRFELQTSVGSADVFEIVFKGELSVITLNVPVSKITQYRSIDDKTPISQSLQFNFDVDDQPVELTIHKLDHDDGMLLAMQTTWSKKKDANR